MYGRAFTPRSLFQPSIPAFSIAIMLALLPIVPGGADEIARRRPIVLVVVHSSSQNDNAPLSAVSADSFRVELESQGIRVLPSDEHADDDRAIGALAEKNHADFGLWGVYTLAGSEIQLNARWIDPVKKAAAGTASRTGALNLSFDAVVASLVDEIVEGQKKRFEDLPMEQVMQAPPAPAAAQQPAAPPAPAVASDGRPAASPVVSAPKSEPRFAPLAFSLGSAPFIATFTALSYFPVGLTVSLTGLYRIRAPGGLLGFGLATGLNGFHGKGAYTQADFFVIPIGIEFLYGTRTGSPIDFFAHLEGGPAILTAKPATGNSLTKVIPFISGGVGMTVSFFESIGLSLEGNYVCFFDSPDPILGFAPSLSVVVKL